MQYGWDYEATSNSVELINSVTSSTTMAESPKIELTFSNGEASYKYYYWVHRLGDFDNWYNMGQILETHLTSIKDQGYNSIITFRENEEQTNRLANETNRVGLLGNKEFSNFRGNYDVIAEKLAVESIGLSFYHLPVPPTFPWSTKLFNQYRVILENVLPPAIVHCSSGYRSSAYVVAYLASIQNHCTSWAFQSIINSRILL